MPVTRVARAQLLARVLFHGFGMARKLEDYNRYKHYAQTFYEHLWDFFWTPIAVTASFSIRFRVVRRSRFAPWVLGACYGRWPERIHDEHYTICSDEQCETCLSLESDEIDIDYDNEIKHDPFNLLPRVKTSRR